MSVKKGLASNKSWNLIGSGGWNWTNDLQVMSLISYHCSTPQQLKTNSSFVPCHVIYTRFFALSSTFLKKSAAVSENPVPKCGNGRFFRRKRKLGLKIWFIMLYCMKSRHFFRKRCHGKCCSGKTSGGFLFKQHINWKHSERFRSSRPVFSADPEKFRGTGGGGRSFGFVTQTTTLYYRPNRREAEYAIRGAFSFRIRWSPW